MAIGRLKYRNTPVFVENLRFDSKAEAERWVELRMLERSGQISALKRQVPLQISAVSSTGKEVPICVYRADFIYYDRDGSETIEDVKGVRTDTYLLKKKMLRLLHGIEITETGAKRGSRARPKRTARGRPRKSG